MPKGAIHEVLGIGKGHGARLSPGPPPWPHHTSTHSSLRPEVPPWLVLLHPGVEPSWQALPLQPPSKAGGDAAATSPWLPPARGCPRAQQSGTGTAGEAAPSQTCPGSSGSPHAVCHASGRCFNCPLAGDGLEKGGNEELGAL